MNTILTKRKVIILVFFVTALMSSVKAYGDIKETEIKMIEKQIEEYISSRDISFYYESIETGESFSHNTVKRYASASTIKLPIVLCVYQMASGGALDLDETMTYTSGYYYEGSGIIRYQPVGTEYTIRQLTQYCVQHSDNIAYSMLRAKIGNNNLNRYIESQQGAFTNYFNSREISVYLKALYKFAEENTELGQELLSYFVDTEFEDRIPAALPSLQVAHKVGMLPLVHIYHDAAIIYDSNPYVLVIMTNGAKNNKTEFFTGLTELIHQRHIILNHDYYLKPGKISIDGKKIDIGNIYYSSLHNEILLPVTEILKQLSIEYICDEELNGYIFSNKDNNIFIFPQYGKVYVNTSVHHYRMDYVDDIPYVSESFINDVLGVKVTI